MMFIEELDGNPLLGKRTFLGYDAATDELVQTDVFDKGVTAATFDRNHDLKDVQGGGDFRLVASIPAEVQVYWMSEYGVDIYNPDHSEKVMQLLNDGDFRKTRINEGRL